MSLNSWTFSVAHLPLTPSYFSPSPPTPLPRVLGRGELRIYESLERVWQEFGLGIRLRIASRVFCFEDVLGM